METNLPSDSGGKETEGDAGEQSARKNKGKGRAAPDVECIQEDPQDMMVIDDTESDEEDPHHLIDRELQDRFGPGTYTSEEAIQAVMKAEGRRQESQEDINVALRTMQQQDQERLEHARQQERERLARSSQQHILKELKEKEPRAHQSAHEYVNLPHDQEQDEVSSEHAKPGPEESSRESGIPMPGRAMGPPPLTLQVRKRQPAEKEPKQMEPSTQGGRATMAQNPDHISYKDAQTFLMLHSGKKMFTVACITCKNWLVVVTKRVDLPPANSTALIKSNAFAAALCHRCQREKMRGVGLGLTYVNTLPPTVCNDMIEDWRLGMTIRTCLNLTMSRPVPYTVVLWDEVKRNIQAGDATFVGNDYHTGIHEDAWFFPGVPNGFL